MTHSGIGKYGLLLAIGSLCLLSCTKKGDFIREGDVGSGIHYYPVILNEALYDTVSRQYLGRDNVTFSPGQTIVFELDYFSQDPVESLELWAGESINKLHRVLDIPYRPSLYSPVKFIDTVVFRYTIPAGLDPSSEWYMQPGVVTADSIRRSMDVMLKIK